MNTIKRYWIVLPGLLLVMALSVGALSQDRISGYPDALQYLWTFEPDSIDLWQADVTSLGARPVVFGYEQWSWRIRQTVIGDHSGTATDSLQFSLWGWGPHGELDSLFSFVAESDSTDWAASAKWPKHHTMDIGAAADTLYFYYAVRMQARFLSADTGFGGGTSPRYEIDLTIKKR